MKILYLLLLGIVGCVSVQKIDKDKINSIAKSKFGEKVSIIYNNSRSYALCSNYFKPKGKYPDRILQIGIINAKSKKFVYESEKINASAKWLNDSIIVINAESEVHSSDPKLNEKSVKQKINVYKIKY